MSPPAGMRPLATPRLEMVPLDPDRDAADLHLMHGDPQVAAFDPTDNTTTDVTQTRERLAAELADNGGWTWVVRLRPSPTAIGTFGIFSDQGRPIRGLSWRLRRDHWGRGIMSEAARVGVEHLLAQPGVDGVEAWIHSGNTRSLGVARAARLDERGRLPAVHRGHIGQWVVMARAATPADPDVLAARPVLLTADVARTATLLRAVLALHVSFEHGQPPTLIRLGVSPWAGSPGIDVRRSDGPVPPATVMVDLGCSVDDVHERAKAAGLAVAEPPQDRPWYRRELTMVLPEGHRIQVSGGLPPAPGGGPT